MADGLSGQVNLGLEQYQSARALQIDYDVTEPGRPSARIIYHELAVNLDYLIAHRDLGHADRPACGAGGEAAVFGDRPVGIGGERAAYGGVGQHYIGLRTSRSSPSELKRDQHYPTRAGH